MGLCPSVERAGERNGESRIALGVPNPSVENGIAGRSGRTVQVRIDRWQLLEMVSPMC